jgi:hypothetical protein
VVESFMADANAKIYFSELNGMEKLVELIEKEEFNKKPWDLLFNFTESNFVYKEKFMKLGGIQVCLKLLDTAFTLGKEKSSVYDDVEQIFEFFVSLTEEEKLRYSLAENNQIIKYLNISFFHISMIVKKEFEALASLISFTSNLVLTSERI